MATFPDIQNQHVNNHYSLSFLNNPSYMKSCSTKKQIQLVQKRRSVEQKCNDVLCHSIKPKTNKDWSGLLQNATGETNIFTLLRSIVGLSQTNIVELQLQKNVSTNSENNSTKQRFRIWMLMRVSCQESKPRNC